MDCTKSKEAKELYNKAVVKWGRETQIDKIQEEAQELALALHQYKCPTKNKEEMLTNIYTELADMKIMLAQAEILFNKERINSLAKAKLEKLKEYFDK